VRGAPSLNSRRTGRYGADRSQAAGTVGSPTRGATHRPPQHFGERRTVNDGVLLRRDATYSLGEEAPGRLEALGIDIVELERRRRPLVRGCLDWSQRELHLAGTLGAALTEWLFAHGWIKRRTGNRSVVVTAAGCAGFAAEFGLELINDSVAAV
jgi:hypothetical protein